MMAGAERIAAAFAALFLITCSEARAQQRVALVVGNSAYQNTAMLPNPVRDAKAVAELLTQAGFDVVHARSDLGNLDFKRAVREFSEVAQRAEIAVLYFAGHGLELGGTNYLIPVDARLATDYDVEDEAISLNRLVRALEPASRLRLVILDACRNNPLLRTMQRTASVRAVARGLAGIEPPTSNTLIAYAARAGSVAEDGSGLHSPFTAALLKHVTQPGLDVQMAFRRVRDEVLKATNNRQEPFVYGSLGGDEIPLRPLPQVGKPMDSDLTVSQRQYRIAERIGNREAWEAFLGVHTSGLYAELARTQLAKLIDDERLRLAAEREARAQAERLERERIDRERVAREQAAREQAERERVAREQVERERREQVAREKATREQAERERIAREQTERERLERDRIARENAENLRREHERQRELTERTARERLEREAAARAEQERERLAREEDKSQAVGADPVQTAMLTSVTEPSLPPSNPAAALSGGALVQEIKKELKRVGCYDGRVDEKWPTDEASSSVKKFARYAKLAATPRDLTEEFLEILRGKFHRVCPLECAPGEIARNGRCVRNPKDRPRVAARPPARAPAESASPPAERGAQKGGRGGARMANEGNLWRQCAHKAGGPRRFGMGHNPGRFHMIENCYRSGGRM